ncbi:DinB family protein [Sinorhizobium sp. CCBAU 05631]|uniref:DinB family protein n=1 Tax=Sinorhizobium sp. CCBAU 05631 TaxID=794846 RepID=UPI0026C12DC2
MGGGADLLLSFAEGNHGAPPECRSLLYRHAAGRSGGPAEPARQPRTPAEFAAERAEVDDWLVDFCETLTLEVLSRKISIPWPDRTLTETVADTLLHVFLHGQHHRGQIHSMLSGTSVPPPQIDEFILADNAEARVEDLAALDWSETLLMR